jgi:hypothetical protein
MKIREFLLVGTVWESVWYQYLVVMNLRPFIDSERNASDGWRVGVLEDSTRAKRAFP